MSERNPLVLTLMSFDPFDCLRKEGRESRASAANSIGPAGRGSSRSRDPSERHTASRQ